MKKLNLPYLTAAEAESFLFYQVPQALVDDETFSDLDGWAILLYSFMISRAGLSVKNKAKFTDKKNGQIYIIFTIAEVMKKCRCGKNTAIKLMKQLEDIGLIEKKRQGLGKPSLIYVKNFSHYKNNKNDDKSNTFKAKTSDEYKINITSFNNKQRKVCRIKRSNIYNNQNQNNNIDDVSIYQSEPENDTPVKEQATEDNAPIDMIDNDTPNNVNKESEAITVCKVYTPEEVAHNISLNELKTKYADKKEEVVMIYNLISEVLTEPNPDSSTVRIAKQNFPLVTVKNIFALLEKTHVEYVIDCLNKNDNKYKIKSNTKSYLMTSLFNAPRTISYYFNRSFNQNDNTPVSDGDLSAFNQLIQAKRKSSFDLEKFAKKASERSLNY
jgi:hypothetical protein